METLQLIWFILIAILLIGYAVLDGFDLGVGVIHLFTKDETNKRINLKAIGPFWDGNEVWLLTGGGAIFAAFPDVYATIFSGFYLPLIIILLALIFRAVSIEMRKATDEKPCWYNFWDKAFALGSLLPIILFGVALGNIVMGLDLDQSKTYHGILLDLLTPYPILVGVTALTSTLMHGALYLSLKSDERFNTNNIAIIKIIWPIHMILFSAVTYWSLYNYTRELVVLPILFAGLAFTFFASIKIAILKNDTLKSFIFSSLAIAFTLISYASSIYPFLVPPRTVGLENSLTIFNASASTNTLLSMLIIALIGMPFVIWYTIYVYKVFKGKVA